MKFNRIDQQNWKRKEYFEHYFSDVPCTYSVTVNLDITKLLDEIRRHTLKLYPVMIYGISHIVNRHEEFRMSIDNDGNVGFFDEVNPSYTVFHEDDETFSDIWTEYNPDFKSFYQHYLQDIQQFGDIKGMRGKPPQGRNIFTISCVPWATFTGLNLNLKKDSDYLPPIFTIGKYFNENGKTLLPLSIQAHHAVCDGFHLARFVNELQEWGDRFSDAGGTL